MLPNRVEILGLKNPFPIQIRARDTNRAVLPGIDNPI
jgi:hypothetical protein